MKEKLQRGLAFLLSLAMVLGSTLTAGAEGINTGSTAITPGTYTVPVSNSDPVAAMNTEFGGVVGSTATAEVKKDGTVDLTLSMQTIQVMGNFDAWIDAFSGYYEGVDEEGNPTNLISNNIATTSQEITVNDGSTQTALATATFTANSVQDSYTLAYHLKSTVMSFDRKPTLTVDWSNRVLIKAAEADRTALNAKIEEVAAMDSTSYTAESWNKLADVTNAARELPADATQEQVDAALAEINAAIAALVTEQPAPEGAVASITAADGTVTYYNSLFDQAEVTDESGNVTTPAVAGAVSSLKGGETLTLLQDEATSGLAATNEAAAADFHLDGSAVFNMNGKTVTMNTAHNNGYAFRVSAGSLTVQGGVLNVENGGGWRVDAGASLTITGSHRASAKFATVDCYGSVKVEPGVYLENLGSSNVVWGGGNSFAGMVLDGVTVYGAGSGSAVSVSKSSVDTEISVTNCNVTSEAGIPCSISGNSTNITVKDSTFIRKSGTGSSYALVFGSKVKALVENVIAESTGMFALVANVSSQVTVNSGKFKAELGAVRTNSKAVVTYPEGMVMSNTPDADGYYTLIKAEDYVPRKAVQIGENYYEDFDSALAAAKDGDTIVLLMDAATIASSTLGDASVPASTTLDLNGHKLSIVGRVTLNQNLTILDSTDNKSELVFSGDIYAKAASGLTLKGLTVYSSGNSIVSWMASDTGLQIEDCTIHQQGGVLVNGQSGFNSPLHIKNSEIIGTESADKSGYFTIRMDEDMEAGKVVVEDTTIRVADGTYNALNLDCGNAIIRNCTISGGKYGVVASSDTDVIFEGSNNITGTEAAIQAGEKKTVTINGGEYNTDGAYAVSGSRSMITVNGGTFQGTEGVTDGLAILPDGKKLTRNEENRWALADKTGNEPEEAAEAQIIFEDGSTKNVASINHLAFFLEGNCTVKLLTDVTLTDGMDVPAGVNLTFDLNGKKISDVHLGEEGEFDDYLFSTVAGTLVLTDSSEAQTGTVALKTGDENYSSALFYQVAGEITVDAGTYTADMVAGVVTKTINLVGGTWNIGIRSCAMAFGGDISISGGHYSSKAPSIMGKNLKTGYKFSDEMVDGYYNIEEKENIAPYPVASVLRDSTGTVLTSDAEVTVDMDGKAWLTATLDTMDTSKVTGVKDPDGNAVEFKTETTEEGTVRLLMPLTAVYEKADEANYSIFAHGMYCMLITLDGANYDLTFRWSEYEGPVGTSTASDTAINVKAEVAAMGTKMEFNVTGTMYTFENGYTFLKMPIDDMSSQYSSSSGIAFGDIKNFQDEDGKEPKYKLMEKAPADMTKFDKFEQFDYVKNLLVSTSSMQESATMTIAVKVNAMGFDVDLDGALVTWDNPNVTLDKLIENAENTLTNGNENAYTADSWNALKEALAAAKNVKNDASATDEAKAEAKANLKAAMKGLTERTDWTSVNEAIAKAEALKQSDYTEESWNALQTALEAAKTGVSEDTADQKTADKLASDLNDAIAALEKKPSEETRKPMKPGTYEVTVDMRKANKTSETSMAAAILNKKGTLTVAADGSMKLTLTFPKDAQIAGLASHATGLDVYEQDGTTKMNVETVTYETTLYEGISASAPSYTGKALESATIDLSYEAEDGIYKAYIYADRMKNDIALYVDFSGVSRQGDSEEPAKADKTQLQTVIDKAEALKQSDYTADSWAKVASALATAKSVNNNASATQAQVNEAMNSLSSAMSALVRAEKNDDKKDDDKKNQDYTPGTYKAPITMHVDAMNQDFLIDGSVIISDDGRASMYIDFSRISSDGGKTWTSAYDSGTVYYLAFNGYSTDGTSASMTTKNVNITWTDVQGKNKNGNTTTYHCLDKVTFPLPYLTTDSNGIAEYLMSLKFFVPGMSHLEFAEDGFDYLVRMTVDLSDIPVKTTVDNNKNNSNNNNSNSNNGSGSNGNGNGGSNISVTPAISTKPSTSGTTTTPQAPAASTPQGGTVRRAGSTTTAPITKKDTDADEETEEETLTEEESEEETLEAETKEAETKEAKSAETTSEKSEKSHLPMILWIVAAVLAVGAGGFYWFTAKKSKKDEE